MKKETKEIIQYALAIIGFMSAIILVFINFFMYNCIEDSVLWYTAQMLLYAASTFGFSLYIQSKWGEVKSILDDLKEKQK